jgi:hypothetical protein
MTPISAGFKQLHAKLYDKENAKKDFKAAFSKLKALILKVLK